MSSTNINIKLLMSDEWYDFLSKGLIPINNETIKFKEYIEIWNSKGISELLNQYDELYSYNSEFIDFLKLIRDIIRNQTVTIDSILDDFKYFEDKFLFDYKNLLDQYKKEKAINDKKRQEELEITRIYDISCGIFSPTEANSRMIYNSLHQTLSEKESILIRQINFLIDQFYIYLYMKTEQAIYQLSLVYSCSMKKYLMQRFLSIKENSNLFTNKDESKINELNDFWVSMKHQTDNKKYENNYKEEIIFENLNFVKKIYNELKKIEDLENFVDKYHEFYDEIDGVLNPLGLTGFECD